MKKINHPLTKHLKAEGETLASFAARVGVSRMHLYRVMAGQNTTRDLIEKISEATNGRVPVTAFFDEVRA